MAQKQQQPKPSPERTIRRVNERPEERLGGLLDYLHESDDCPTKGLSMQMESRQLCEHFQILDDSKARSQPFNDSILRKDNAARLLLIPCRQTSPYQLCWNARGVP